jgi:phosphatidylserine decarboxylase
LKLAQGSTIWVGTPLLATFLLILLKAWYLSAVALALLVLMFLFHRDPDRMPLGTGMVSPADGLVVEASLDRVAIFMNHHNVHVNRSPLVGRVTKIEHRDGGHLPAFHRSSRKNERNLIVLDTPQGEVRICQITGLLVRRIVCYVKPGDRVERGERIGMIRFGSRVEFDLPSGFRLQVGKGERVRAGETVVAVREE